MVILIVKKYLDGEIESILGYVTDDKVANSRVKELNDTIGVGDNFFYTTEFVDEVK